MLHSENFKKKYDIKEIQKRTSQLLLVCILVSLILMVYDIRIGLHYSVYLVGAFTFLMLILYFLNYKIGDRYVKGSLVIILCLTLSLGTWIEGLGSGHFFYFFPMLIIIPAIMNNTGENFSEFLVYNGFAIFSSIVCFWIGIKLPPLESLPPSYSTVLFFINLFVSFGLSVIFGFLNLKYEKEYIKAIQEQKNTAIEARSRFLSIMGHELRTPLNGIIGASNILKMETNPKEFTEYLEILSYCSDHMLLLVNDILDFNKIEAGKMEIRPIPVNLSKMLRKSALPFFNLFESKNIQFLIDIDPKLDTWVEVDDVRLVQIINNLFSNALKFTEFGKVEFKVRVLHTSPDRLEVDFTVKDTGPGIDKEFQKLVFESFFQIYDESNRSFTGTGLGLAICMRLLKLMNSTLKLDSSPGVGSEFSFILSLPIINLENVHIPLERTIHNLEGIRILLVEDNEINMLIAKKTLLDFKAKIKTAYNGKEALELLETDRNFDLVLLDLEMPVLNGYMSIGPILKIIPGTPVLAFTASLIDQDKQAHLMGLGFTDFILKPYQIQTLLETILRTITRKSQMELPTPASTTTTGVTPTKATKATASTITPTESTAITTP